MENKVEVDTLGTHLVNLLSFGRCRTSKWKCQVGQYIYSSLGIKGEIWTRDVELRVFSIWGVIETRDMVRMQRKKSLGQNPEDL